MGFETIFTKRLCKISVRFAGEEAAISPFETRVKATGKRKLKTTEIQAARNVEKRYKNTIDLKRPSFLTCPFAREVITSTKTRIGAIPLRAPIKSSPNILTGLKPGKKTARRTPKTIPAAILKTRLISEYFLKIVEKKFSFIPVLIIPAFLPAEIKIP